MHLFHRLTLVLLSLLAASSVAHAALKDPGAPEGWLSDMDQAEELARKENRPLLLFFTGSDWCAPCQRLKQSVFEKPAFMSYAADNLVLVYLDFPNKRKLPASLTYQNEALAERFKVKSYPTVWVLSSEGKSIGKLSSMEGGPKTYVRAIRELVSSAPKAD